MLGDFWTIDVQCSRKTPLKEAGFARQQIITERTGWKLYGRRSATARKYPIYTHRVQVAAVDLVSGRERLEQVERDIRAKYEPLGLRVHVRYWPMD